RGNQDMHYRLHVGDIPVVTEVFPLGLQKGTEADIALEGVNLGMTRTVHVKAGANVEAGTRIPAAVSSPKGVLGHPTVVVGEFPEVPDRTTSGTGAWPSIPVPGTANGRIALAGATQTWRFAAKKGQPLILEVNARRLGSPLDSYIEVLDARGQPLPRAVL